MRKFVGNSFYVPTPYILNKIKKNPILCKHLENIFVKYNHSKISICETFRFIQKLKLILFLFIKTLFTENCSKYKSVKNKISKL